MGSYLQTKFRLLLSLLLVGICVLASSTFAIHPTAFALTNDAYQIITQDLASGQMNIHLPAGSYVVSQGIKITEPNVQIYGDGENSTILTPNNASINTLISFRYADNFSIHDLQITGIAVGQTSPTSNNGIITSQSNYGLIENIYAHDFKQFTIEYQNANGGLILNNLVVNSGSNGISINDENGGQGTVVKGNVVDGASDVGITAFVGRNFLAANNTVRNVALHSSPFGENVHWGMAVEGDHLVAGATSSNVTYSNNLIVNCGAAGLVATANNNQTSTGVDHNISFYNNTVMNSASGLIVSDVDGFISKGNLFTSFPASAKAGITVYQGLSSNIDIENEFIGPLPLTATAGVIIYGGSGKFVNSTIVTNRYPAIFVSQAVKPNWILSYTVITNSNTTSTTSSTSSTSTIEPPLQTSSFVIDDFRNQPRQQRQQPRQQVRR